MVYTLLLSAALVAVMHLPAIAQGVQITGSIKQTHPDGKTYTLTYFGSSVNSPKYASDLVFQTIGHGSIVLDGKSHVVVSGGLEAFDGTELIVFFPDSPEIADDGSIQYSNTIGDNETYMISTDTIFCSESGEESLPQKQNTLISMLLEEDSMEVLLVQSGAIKTKVNLTGGTLPNSGIFKPSCG